jgi:hypothetical protein
VTDAHVGFLASQSKHVYLKNGLFFLIRHNIQTLFEGIAFNRLKIASMSDFAGSSIIEIVSSSLIIVLGLDQSI